MLDLDEALDSELVRAREMVVELDQPGAERPVRLLGVPVKLSRTPGDPAARPARRSGEHTDEVLRGGRLRRRRRSPRCRRRARSPARPAGAQGSLPGMSATATTAC